MDLPALKLIKKSPPTDMLGVSATGEPLGLVHPAAISHMLLPHLFTFSYLCREEDVPKDLQIFCLWALRKRIEALNECPEGQLRPMLAAPDGTIVPNAKTFMTGQTRTKIVNHFLFVSMASGKMYATDEVSFTRSPDINRPAEALPYLKASMKQDEEMRPMPKDPFLRNPGCYVLYGTVLARAGSHAEARPVLEKALRDIDKVNDRGKVLFIQAKLYLSRVLRRMGSVEEAEKQTGCKENAAYIKRIEALKATSPVDSRIMEDWRCYRSSSFNDRVCYHALGLKHDVNRGKSHIIIKRMEYLHEGGKDVLDRFRVVEAGVFRINDVLTEIDVQMGYSIGESREVLDELLGEHEHAPGNQDQFPFFTLFISNDKRIESFLTLGHVKLQTLQDMKYNPNWRNDMNRTPFFAKSLHLSNGVQDAEYDYMETSGGSPMKSLSSSVDGALPGLRGMFNKK
ncbi:hypothetical protein VNI00_019022 [Paramarasmius palmivorus]|uniref:Uncharacterized protein n=1 Tax=Paramarasmius palmivorus TaxID=297713 RepID=A0AAW0ARA0_9AGAR